METEQEISDNLKQLRRENNQAHSDISDLLEKQNGRVRELEKWRGYLTGALAILTFATIVAVTFFGFTLSE